MIRITAPIRFSSQPPPAAPPRLTRGGKGVHVSQLQTLLRARMPPSIGLKADGIFGWRTFAAVRTFQRGRGITADGVVGPITWSHLLGGIPASVPADPVKGIEPRHGRVVIRIPRTVWEWPLRRKLTEVVRRVPERLPGEARREFAVLMQPEALALMLSLIALMSLLSGGVAIAVGLLALGMDIGMALVSSLQTASLASSESDLDQSADQLAHVIIALGTAAFIATITAVAARARAMVGAKGPSPVESSRGLGGAEGPETAGGTSEAPAVSSRPPPPMNSTLSRMRSLPRSGLRREIRRATGDEEIVLWEQVDYGDIYTPVRAGKSAEALGVRSDDFIGYRVPGGLPKGGAIGDLGNKVPQDISPYGDPFL